MPSPRRNWNNSNQTSGEINVTWNPDLECYETWFPYNQDFIGWIKQNIPSGERELDFDRSRKHQYIWKFSQAAMEGAVLPMMRAVFKHGTFTVVDKKKVDEYNQGFKKTVTIDTNAWKIEFRNLVREAGIPTDIPDRKQYLRACMYYHPDRNPANADKMSRLNQIWTTVFEPKVVQEEPANV